MKALGMIPVLSLLLAMSAPVEAGWNWKFWQKKSDCVETCVEEPCVVDCCIDEPCCGDGCCDIEHRGLFRGELIGRSRHWLSSVCGDECCGVDLCCPDDDCCVSDSCCDGGSCLDSFIDIWRRERCKTLAQWIYQAQTACSPFDRCRAIHRIGTDFSCECYPEVMCALIYAMKDCEPRVRVEAADEIGDQLRKSLCCCNSQLICTLKCALNDENWRVRREAAQALRICGLSVPYRDGGYCVDGYLPGCCDDGSCVGGCCDDCCIDSYCTPHELPSMPAEPVHEAVREMIPESAETPKKVEEPKKEVRKKVILPEPEEIAPEKKKKDKPKERKTAPPAEKKIEENKDKKKGSYVPEDDSTSFIMPNIRQTVGMAF
ncbi:HEAT repeat domain-containing protein [Rubinisphaera margarita]|uniref:HEAT repeat domain-containing protein n=1 Tax=Rubinisphaera margarita TaxID=2909586 RepID=UPI001EE87099|nr:HEAT repeat domain-containing protein [Rubinisphaera margarita]MCG6154482.1 HEAT repeat domain-containing protein [Rubinisphaera margarita]